MDYQTWIILISVGVLIIFALIGRARVRRLARDAMCDEIATKSYDEHAMHQAIVESGGNNEKARRLYIQKRMRAHSDEKHWDVYRRDRIRFSLFTKILITLFVAFFAILMIYNFFSKINA